jgi:hypothetical protein
VNILDWAHVSGAMHKAIRAVRRPGRAQKERRRQFHQMLPEHRWHGDVDAPLGALGALGRCDRPRRPNPFPSSSRRCATWKASQRTWLGDYAAWQEQGYPVGSGLIERAVAVVINGRMKGRGMRWCRANAAVVVALRVRELHAGWASDENPLPLAA